MRTTLALEEGTLLFLTFSPGLWEQHPKALSSVSHLSLLAAPSWGLLGLFQPSGDMDCAWEFVL